MSATSAIEGLLNTCEKYSDSQGVLHFTNSFTKKTGDFYLDKGAIYAVTLEGYSIPLLERLRITERLDDYGTLATAIRDSGGENSPYLPYNLLKGQFVDEAGLRNVLKDFFLTMAHEVLAWEAVTTKWEPKTFIDGYPIPPIEGGKLIEVLILRQGKLDEIGSEFGIPSDEILARVEVAPGQGEIDYTDLTPEEVLIIHAGSDAPARLNSLVDLFSMTPNSVIRTAYSLWTSGEVTLFVDGVDISTNFSDDVFERLDASEDVSAQLSRFLQEHEDEENNNEGQENATYEPALEIAEEETPEVDDIYTEFGLETVLDEDTSDNFDFTPSDDDPDHPYEHFENPVVTPPAVPAAPSPIIESLVIENATFSGAHFQNTTLQTQAEEAIEEDEENQLPVEESYGLDELEDDLEVDLEDESYGLDDVEDIQSDYELDEEEIEVDSDEDSLAALDKLLLETEDELAAVEDVLEAETDLEEVLVEDELETETEAELEEDSDLEEVLAEAELETEFEDEFAVEDVLEAETDLEEVLAEDELEAETEAELEEDSLQTLDGLLTDQPEGDDVTIANDDFEGMLKNLMTKAREAREDVTLARESLSSVESELTSLDQEENALYERLAVLASTREEHLAVQEAQQENLDRALATIEKIKGLRSVLSFED